MMYVWDLSGEIMKQLWKFMISFIKIQFLQEIINGLVAGFLVI